MSQYPQPPMGQPPMGGGYTPPPPQGPYGQGPMGQDLYGGMPYVRPRTSGMAVTSLVLSLIFCVPVLSILAVLFGIIGIKKTGNPAVRGRGMAITGVVIGALVTMGWVGLTWTMVKGFDMIVGEIRTFASDLGQGDAAGAKNFVSGLAATKVDQSAHDMKDLGKVTDMKRTGWDYRSDANAKGGGVWVLEFDCTYEHGSKHLKVDLVSNPNGGLSIGDYEFK